MMQKRDQLILQYVNQKGKVSVVELSEMLSVAVETIRRDLTALEKKIKDYYIAFTVLP